MSLDYVLVEGVRTEYLELIHQAAQTIEPFPRDRFIAHLNRQHQVLSCLAYDSERLVGYKIGYQIQDGYFESWNGGVIPEYRRRGIASELIRRQHQWCLYHGFSYINTMTSGDNQAMLICNLKAGFRIVGTYHDRNQVLKVILQKHLTK